VSASAEQPESALELAPGVWIARSDLDFTFSRSSGPGGQAVNKLSTRAQLRVAVGVIQGLDEPAAARLRRLAGKRLTQEDEILLEAQTYRSQLDNKQLAIERLQQLVTAALVRPKVRRKKKPTRAMKEKRLAGKRLQSEKKQSRREKRSGGE
jgi:ribosome-associated protein